MKLLTEGREVSLDTQESIGLVKDINAWSNSIKNHSFQNLGDQSSISSIVYKPAYIVDLLTRYEIRVLSHTQIAYTNQAVEEQTISELSQVDRWDYDLPRDDKDIFNKKIWSIPGSKKVITCPECSGKKEVVCPDCSHGKVVCHSCGGRGEHTCTACNGKGSHRCSSCNGVGYTTTSVTKTRMKYTSYEEPRSESYTEYTKHTCKSCGGKGYFPCDACMTKGTITCNICGGSGKLTCKTCGGSAKITCPSCEGNGQVLKYIKLEHSFNDKNNKRSKLYDLLDKHFPKLVDLVQTLPGKKIFDEFKSIFSENYFSNYPYIANEYNALFTETEGVVQESKSSITINQQQLQVYEIPVYEISYSYKEKNYSLLICGSNYQIYAPVSPISEYSDSLLKKAKSFFKTGKFSQSLDYLEKCISMNQENVTESVYALKERAIKSIYRDYKVGSLIGFLFAIGLFTIMINLHSSDIYFIIPRVTKFYNKMSSLAVVVPWMLSGIYSIIMIWFISKNSKYTINKYGLRIKSTQFRISASVINFLIFAIGAGILLYLINSTGLLNPIALVISYFYEKFGM